MHFCGVMAFMFLVVAPRSNLFLNCPSGRSCLLASSLSPIAGRDGTSEPLQARRLGGGGFGGFGRTPPLPGKVRLVAYSLII